jgi:hypothetical protein
LKISPDSQMRKLPAQFAQGLAMRLKNQAGDSSGAPANPAAAPPSGPSAANGERGGGFGGPGGTSGAGGQRGGDFQQMIARMPAASLADLQKGDAVMIVSTQGGSTSAPVVITLLAGVEPILRASSKGAQDMILSPWSLGGGEPSGN